MNDNKTNVTALQKAFNVEDFRKNAHEIVDVLCNHLQQTQSNNIKVFDYVKPDEEYQFWAQGFEQQENIATVFQKILDRSINLHHPHYIGHQVSAPALISGLGSLISSIMSNGSAVYELVKPIRL